MVEAARAAAAAFLPSWAAGAVVAVVVLAGFKPELKIDAPRPAPLDAGAVVVVAAAVAKVDVGFCWNKFEVWPGVADDAEVVAGPNMPAVVLVEAGAAAGVDANKLGVDVDAAAAERGPNKLGVDIGAAAGAVVVAVFAKRGLLPAVVEPAGAATAAEVLLKRLEPDEAVLPGALGPAEDAADWLLNIESVVPEAGG